VLGLFDGSAGLERTAAYVYENLPGVNDERAFGNQYIVDEEDYVIDKNLRLLIGATTLPLTEIVKWIHGEGGLAIASHIDREGFGIIGQLGFVPPDLELDALEVSPRVSLEEARRVYGAYGLPLITSSDAHYPDEIGKSSTCFLMESASVCELGKALRAQAGRKVVS
jgi:PHP family Zn ribbon phosphoesterase